MNRKSLILSALMFVVDFFSALFKELKKRNVTEEQIFDAMKSKSNLIPQMAERFADIIAGVAKNTDILHVLSNLSLSDRIARGKYDWMNSDITEKHFPTNILRDYDVEYKLFHFDRSINSEDVLKAVEQEGFRPGTLAELLALGEAQSDLQKQFTIIALDSTWQSSVGSCAVPVLGSDEGERELGLKCFWDDWDDDDRFLAVRKPA